MLCYKCNRDNCFLFMKTRSTMAQDSDLVQFKNEIRQIQADLIARDEHYRSIHEEIRRK